MRNNADWIRSILESIKTGPSEAELDEAPTLDRWSNVSYPNEDVMRLHGVVTGHPTIDDRTLTTSPLFAVDVDSGLARSRSRWYRLTPNFVPANEHERDAELAALVRCLDVQRKSLWDQLAGQAVTE